jgi:hypothetical protein
VHPLVIVPGGFERALGYAVSALFAGLAVAFVAGAVSIAWPENLLAVGLGLGFAAGSWVAWRATRCSLWIDDEGVSIVGVLGSERRLRWSEIRRATVGQGGLTIELRDGGIVTTSLVAKSNYARWSGEDTRADAVAGMITWRASGSRE